MVAPIVRVLQVGQMAFGQANHLQRILANQHLNSCSASSAGTIILLEHSPVYTVGIRKREEYSREEARLRELGAEFCITDRGGLVTFHGPGQMIAYPVINLRFWKSGLRAYVERLEAAAVRTVTDGFGLHSAEAQPPPYTGVWIGTSKICALGVHASRQITTHGLALNCNVDLKWFEHVVPCGLEGRTVTSLSEQLKRNVDIEEVLPFFLKAFSHVFQCNLSDYPQNEMHELYQKIQSYDC